MRRAWPMDAMQLLFAHSQAGRAQEPSPCLLWATLSQLYDCKSSMTSSDAKGLPGPLKTGSILPSASMLGQLSQHPCLVFLQGAEWLALQLAQRRCRNSAMTCLVGLQLCRQRALFHRRQKEAVQALDLQNVQATSAMFSPLHMATRDSANDQLDDQQILRQAARCQYDVHLAMH